MNQGVV